MPEMSNLNPENMHQVWEPKIHVRTGGDFDRYLFFLLLLLLSIMSLKFRSALTDATHQITKLSTSVKLDAPRIGPLITMGLLIRGFRAVVLDLRSSLGFRGGIRESPAAESSKASVLAVFLGREDFRRARVKVLFTKLRLGEDAGGEEAEGKTLYSKIAIKIINDKK